MTKPHTIRRIDQQFHTPTPTTGRSWKDDPFAITAPIDPQYHRGWRDDAGYTERSAWDRYRRVLARGMEVD